jgi:hypothetical protein
MIKKMEDRLVLKEGFKGEEWKGRSRVFNRLIFFKGF